MESLFGFSFVLHFIMSYQKRVRREGSVRWGGRVQFGDGVIDRIFWSFVVVGVYRAQVHDCYDQSQRQRMGSATSLLNLVIIKLSLYSTILQPSRTPFLNKACTLPPKGVKNMPYPSIFPFFQVPTPTIPLLIIRIPSPCLLLLRKQP